MAILTATALWLPDLAAAEDEKPALKIATRSIEASVTIEATVKAYPGLYDNLLAEGRRDMPKWRVEADKDLRKMPEIFTTERRYSHDRTYSPRSVTGRYVSVLRSDFFDGLGAHPNTVVNTILWDLNARKRVSIRPLFKETADDGPILRRLARAVRVALAVEKQKRDMPVQDPDTDIGLSAVEPKLLGIGAVALAPSSEAGKSAGLVFYFSPYAVGGYAEGSYTVYLPASEFKDDLSAEGAALFGGERPKDDSKDDD
jgi:hypothetical protein